MVDLDQQLMGLVRAGDRAAFSQLFEKFKGPIMSYQKSWVQDSNTAEELCQETFLKVYRARESWTPQAKFSTWLWTIARHTALDHLRKKKEVLVFDSSDGDTSAPSVWETLESPLSNAETLLIESLEEQRIQNCMASLSLSEREILGLRIFSELSYEEIAQQLGAPIGTVKTMIYRAKQKLMESFRKEER